MAGMKTKAITILALAGCAAGFQPGGMLPYRGCTRTATVRTWSQKVVHRETVPGLTQARLNALKAVETQQVPSAAQELLFGMLFPQSFSHIKQWHSAQHASMQKVLCAAQRTLQAELGPDFRVQARVKSPLSIFKKLVEGKKVQDLLALRVIFEAGDAETPSCTCEAECMAVHQTVSSLWGEDLPGRFKNYVCYPKKNGYKAIHTTVCLPSGHRLEVQIRTQCMHLYAETGPAAHSRYKRAKTVTLIEGLHRRPHECNWDLENLPSSLSAMQAAGV